MARRNNRNNAQNDQRNDAGSDGSQGSSSAIDVPDSRGELVLTYVVRELAQVLGRDLGEMLSLAKASGLLSSASGRSLNTAFRFAGPIFGTLVGNEYDDEARGFIDGIFNGLALATAGKEEGASENATRAFMESSDGLKKLKDARDRGKLVPVQRILFTEAFNALEGPPREAVIRLTGALGDGGAYMSSLHTRLSLKGVGDILVGRLAANDDVNAYLGEFRAVFTPPPSKAQNVATEALGLIQTIRKGIDSATSAAAKDDIRFADRVGGNAQARDVGLVRFKAAMKLATQQSRPAGLGWWARLCKWFWG